MRQYLMAAAVVIVVTACGSSQSTTASNTGGGGSAFASVTIQDLSFSPSTVTISAGTTVTWTNNGPSAHTATSDSGLWDSGQLSGPSDGGAYGGGGSGGNYQHTFASAGTFTYHCANHTQMTGTITVTP